MSAENKTILIIDDDQDFVAIARTILEAHDLQVITAFDPEAGFSAACAGNPSLILLDVIFYGDTLGFEYCRRLKKDPATSHIPVFMVTSVGDIYGVDFWPADPDILPADDFITKPVRKADLIERVHKILSLNTGAPPA